MTYDEIRQPVTQQLTQFLDIWKRADKKEFFIELIFCLLTPQTSALQAHKAVNLLLEKSILFSANAVTLSNHLNIVRFKNNKAKYIVEAREKYWSGEGLNKVLYQLKDDFQRRDWLVSNVKGFGMKEASHYLRNIGCFKNLAILDRHILRKLEAYKVIDSYPASLSKKVCISIEEKMIEFSSFLKIPMEYLDYIFWYQQRNFIFK